MQGRDAPTLGGVVVGGGGSGGRQTIVDLSIRYCPCLKSLRRGGGEEEEEEADAESGKGGKPAPAQEDGSEDQGGEGGADLDGRIAGLQQRIAELSAIFEEAASQ